MVTSSDGSAPLGAEPITCRCECHGPFGPLIGTVENHVNPTAPYGYLCDPCTARWDFHFLLTGGERRYPGHNVTTKRHRRCPDPAV